MSPEQHADTVREAFLYVAPIHASVVRDAEAALRALAERADTLERELARCEEAARAALSDLAATARDADLYADTIRTFWAKLAPGRTYEGGTGGTLFELLDAAVAAEADRDRLTRRVAQLEAALIGLESAVQILDVMLREPAAEGLMSAEDYRAYVQGAWLGVDEAAESARAALAGGS